MFKEPNNSEISKESKENRSIRLKITEKCPWNCIFCHEEGGWGIDDIRWDEAMQKNIGLVKKMLSIEETHLTGGEPTASRYIEELAGGLTSLGLDVKLTTNGQFSEKKLEELMAKGIKEFNFSIHALNPEDFIKSQKRKNLSWAESNIRNQKEIILKAKELGAKIKLNVLISTEDDIKKAMEVFQYAKENQIPLRFLNDLYNGQVSVLAVDKLAREILKAKKFKETLVRGSSSKSSYYRQEDGFEFGIKEIREYKLKTLCQDCNENCKEQFYGIRMEQRGGRLYIRLCIDRKDGKSLMTVEDFLESEQLKEINKLLN